MCEVTPYMVSTTKRGISVIYHSATLLISTTGVVYCIYIYMVNASGLLTTEIVTHWKQIEL